MLPSSLLPLLLPLALACGDKDGADSGLSDSDADSDADTDTDGSSAGGDALVSADFFADSATLISADTVACTLEDGTDTTCLELRFGSNPVDAGPFCPETVDEIAGLGVYDGPTDPGFQLLSATLWEAMEADGYDIVDADGNVTIENPTGPADGGGAPPPPGPEDAACLEAVPDDALTIVLRIPTVPVVGASVDEIGGVELVGASIDGVPIAGDPPSVVANNGKIPALDACGNHHDPSGYLHMHLASQGMQPVLDAHAITEVRCEHLPQDDTALVGFAKDGFPLYASQDADGSTPDDLDACWGHTAPTADFPDGVYHYHASATAAPNLPPCLTGVAADGAMVLE